jgi:putative SOS response-associated peptidase YedK
MCGRFTLTVSPEQLAETFAWLEIPTGIAPRYNIAPSQPVAVVANDGQNRLDFFTWGLIPSWAKDPSMGSRMINARAETLVEKPAFRAAFRRRRCLILADGFFEWKQEPGRKSKTPMYIRLKSGRPFAFAGLWENWNAPDGSHILSSTIITTAPNALVQSIHNRMPVILPSAAYPLWLATEELPTANLQALLQPYPADEMEAYPVSTLVNNPANELAECVNRVEENR